MTLPALRGYPPEGIDPTSLRESPTALQYHLDLYHPRATKSFFGELANGAETEILADPPVGYVWIINQLSFQNPNASGGTATYVMRVGTGGAVVDRRTVAQSTAASATTHAQGGLCSEAEVTLQVTAGTSVRYSGEAWLVPAQRIQPWRSPALTDSYQAVTLPGIPDGYVLKMPWAGMGNLGPQQWQWALNSDGSNRTVIARVTRGAVAFEFQAAVSTAGLRVAAGCPFVGPLLEGDTFELRCTTAPAANTVYAGGLLALVPLETR